MLRARQAATKSRTAPAYSSRVSRGRGGPGGGAARMGVLPSLLDVQVDAGAGAPEQAAVGQIEEEGVLVFRVDRGGLVVAVPAAVVVAPQRIFRGDGLRAPWGRTPPPRYSGPALRDTTSRPARRLSFFAATLLAAALAPSCGGGGSPTSSSSDAPAQATRVRATVDASRVRRTVDPGRVLGGNVAAWSNPSRFQGATGGYVVDRGARLLRFPGGNLADSFCWITMRASDKDLVKWDDWSWGTSVDQYLAFVRSTGGEPLYSLNPFDHTIDGARHSALDEARQLVRRVVSAGFPGAFYEVGNENDGSWNPMLSSPEYVERFVAFAEMAKREDPSAKMMGPVGSGTEASWRDGFIDGLAARGRLPLLDYFDFHYYGGWISNSNSAGVDLNSPQQIPGYVKAIRDRLAANGGAGIGVALTEYNAAIWDTGATRGANSIEQALWLADTVGVLFETLDVANVWIDLSGNDPHSLLSDASGSVQRTKNYWPMYVAGKTLGLGRRDTAVDVVESSIELAASRATIHAVRGRDGSLGVLLVNKGDALSAEVALAGRGCTGVSALVFDAAAHAAGSGASPQQASCASGTVTVALPKQSVVGLSLGP